MPPRTLPGSMERHREVCRKNQTSTSSGSPSSTSRSPSSEDDVDNRCGSFGDKEEDGQEVREALQPEMSSSQLQQQQELLSRSPPQAAAIIVNRNMTNATNRTNGSGGVGGANGAGVRYSTNTRSAKRISGAARSSSLNTTNNSSNNNNNGTGCANDKSNNATGSGKKKVLPTSEDSEDFSDDSLEDTSLPPPPPPPVVPPPPSLSCPVTPNKRGSIAWEINLDDPLEAGASPALGGGTGGGEGGGELDRVNSGAGGGKVRLTSCSWCSRDRELNVIGKGRKVAKGESD